LEEYEVIGDRSYHGYEPGEIVTEDLSDAEKERAISRGSIRVVGDNGQDRASPEPELAPVEPEGRRKSRGERWVS